MTVRRSAILVIDDDPLVLASLQTVLDREGYRVHPARRGNDGIALMSESPCDLVLCDLNLPDTDGLAVLEQLKKDHPELPVLMITAYGTVDTAVHAMKLGATDYINKPIADFELLTKIRRALDESTLKDENRRLKDEVRRLAATRRLITRDPRMLEILSMAETVAPTHATVLIRGESGTGKTLLAREIHESSARADAPFVEMSCGSLPDPLLESELFGHEQGAFTGALTARQGKFEIAHGGTVFLDEVANATPALQIKLLRVLQDRTFERLGSNESRSIDVRLILATNADLESLCRKGEFREDLYYRINVFGLSLPPLRERKGDIPLLIDHFVRRFCEEYSKPTASVDASVVALLSSHDWPGNIRELENVIERAVVVCQDGTIRLEHLPMSHGPGIPPAEAPAGGIRPLKAAMEVPEREYIRRVLKINGGNRRRTADMLKVNRTTLFNKMKKYGLFTEDLD